MDALVLAGGQCSPEMKVATGVENRALVELAPSRTMLSFVLTALREARSITRVFVVGDVPQGEGYIVVAPGESLLDNILLGLSARGASEAGPVLLVSADIPFVTGEAVEDFLAQARATGAGFCYPIIPMPTYRAQYAQMKRTTLRLREGELTGGNIILADPGFLARNEGAVRRAYAARKSVLRLGRMLGWGLLLRIVISQMAAPSLLSIPDLEVGIARLLGPGATARAVITEHASLGTDIDKPEDVQIARKILGGDNAG